MNFPMQQNYGAGLGGLGQGPVQAMSDRAANQTLIANGGQMFAEGGIANALPKYEYDPVLQRYKLVEPKKDESAGIAGLAKLTPGGSDTTPGEKTAWSQMSNAEKAAYYAANPTMAAITQLGQKGFGMTGLGQLQAYFDPQGVGEAQAVAKGFDPSQTSFGRPAGSLFGFFGSGLEAVPKAGVDVYGYAPVGMNTGAPTPTLAPANQDYAYPGDDSMDIGPSPSGGYDYSGSDGGGLGGVGGSGTEGANGPGDGTASDYARGGIASLAQGGQSHLGDYSDGGRLLRGPGDGVSDSIPATIGNKRPARLADGEFVVPARIVSELGNGSTEAGARKLYAMMARIQQTRGKTVGKDRVAVNSRADKNLPA